MSAKRATKTVYGKESRNRTILPNPNHFAKERHMDISCKDLEDFELTSVPPEAMPDVKSLGGERRTDSPGCHTGLDVEPELASFVEGLVENYLVDEEESDAVAPIPRPVPQATLAPSTLPPKPPPQMDAQPQAKGRKLRYHPGRMTSLVARESYENLLQRPQSRIPVQEGEDVDDNLESLWRLMAKYRSKQPVKIVQDIAHILEFRVLCTRFSASPQSIFTAAALAVRDRLVEAYNDTQSHISLTHSRRVYYLSLEYLLGRSLRHNLLSLKLTDAFVQALACLGVSPSTLAGHEDDAALGNGGLGRLAACIAAAAATGCYPLISYGLFYQFGLFEQRFAADGSQVEHPDSWLTFGSPWLVPRKDVIVKVQFYGEVTKRGRIQHPDLCSPGITLDVGAGVESTGSGYMSDEESAATGAKEPETIVEEVASGMSQSTPTPAMDDVVNVFDSFGDYPGMPKIDTGEIQDDLTCMGTPSSPTELHPEYTERAEWHPGQVILAQAHDFLVPGYGSQNVNCIRLWASKPARCPEYQAFVAGDYYKALRQQQEAAELTSVLYPSDSTPQGRELRLKQEYLLVAASVDDILRRFKRLNEPWERLSDYICIALNDTHPALTIPEMLRILIDIEGMLWHEAWKITKNCIIFTNHTILKEALEEWDLELLSRVLPRHAQLILEINHHFLQRCTTHRFVEFTTPQFLRSVSIVAEGYRKRIRMSHLAIIGSRIVNGVAKIHTDIIQKTIFHSFAQMWPCKFKNITNGVDVRRFVVLANPELARVYSHMLGSDLWMRDMRLLLTIKRQLLKPEYLAQGANKNTDRLIELFNQIRTDNKRRFMARIRQIAAADPVFESFLPPREVQTCCAMYSCMLKRIHSYKRQLLLIFFVIHRYLTLRFMSATERKTMVRRVFVISGKAAAGYYEAKKVIQLANRVAKRINHDTATNQYLQLIVVPNYSVTLAESIIPAADISEQLSTAGFEASGTGNMKFAMNGAILLGTHDGANIEIAEEVGMENCFFFGARADEVPSIRAQLDAAPAPLDSRLEAVVNSIREGMFGTETEFFHLVDRLGCGIEDFYLVAYDFPGYLAAQQRVESLWRQPRLFLFKALTTAVSCWKFSADVTVHNYAKHMWRVEHCPLPPPITMKQAQEEVRIASSYITHRRKIASRASAQPRYDSGRQTPTLEQRMG